MRKFLDQTPKNVIEIRNDNISNQIQLTTQRIISSLITKKEKEQKPRKKAMVKTGEFYNAEQLMILAHKKIAAKKEKQLKIKQLKEEEEEGEKRKKR